MRYTFCAPGAIGKGRGQGLRSLITNGKTLTKCSLSSVYQPNDVVKQYIQEFETRKERDQQKELQTLPCVLLQVMGMTMRKKFVVRENEFMPVNTLLPLSTNEVKPYLKEVVTSSIGKERGKGLTSSSMLSGQVLGTKMHKNSVVCENEYIQFDTPFYPSTNQVKQRTKEAEATIGKGPEGGDVRMGMIRKNSMVLEKEYMQVDTTFSPSTNQVKQRTKEAETIQARSKRNTANRANLTMLHHIGSKPIREIMYQQAQIEEIVKAEPSLPTIEIVEKCWGPQNRSHVGCFDSGVKVKDIKGDTSSKTELLFALCSTRDDNKSLIEEIKSLNNRLSTLEDEM